MARKRPGGGKVRAGAIVEAKLIGPAAESETPETASAAPARALPVDDRGGDEGLFPCTPGARRRPGRVPGVPAVLADGLTWELPFSGLNPVLSGLRDRMYDRSTVRGSVPLSDVRLVAYMALHEDYLLTEEEAAGLILLEDSEAYQKLSDAVMVSLFGAHGDLGSASYTEWAESALLANGIGPQSVPPHLTSLVLEHLVYSRRAMPEGKMVNSASFVRARAKILGGTGQA